MQETASRVERYAANYTAHAAALVELSGGSTAPARFLELCDTVGAINDPLPDGIEWVDAQDFDVDPYELASGQVYDVTEHGVRTRDVTGDRSWTVRSYELLLGGGGPTITLTISVDDEGDVEGATFWHSWGDESAGPSNPRPACSEVASEHFDMLASYLRLLGLGDDC